MPVEEPSRGQILRDFLDDIGASQKDLAEKSGMQEATISNLIQGEEGNYYTKYEKTERNHYRKILKGLVELYKERNKRFSLNIADKLMQVFPRLRGKTLDENNEADAELIQFIEDPEASSQKRPLRYLTRYCTQFIGHDKTIETICTTLQDPLVQLLTLVGLSGIGKTELARQVEDRLRTDFPSEPIFVRLEEIKDSNKVMSEIVHELRLTETDMRPPLERLIEALQDDQRLLILDSFEQVMAANLDLARLIAACPKLKVLVTSLDRLDVRCEHVFKVPFLEVPDPASVSGEKDLLRYPGTALFIQTARAADQNFNIHTRETAQIIAKICQLLNGHPGAIIVVVPHILIYQPHELFHELLTRPFQLPIEGSKDMPTRHQTFKDIVEWSYGTLSPEEQRLFCRLSVFAGGFTLDAAEAVCTLPDEPPLQVRKWVAALINKNLVLQRQPSDNETAFEMVILRRQPSEDMAGFEMLKTYRMYGLEELKKSIDEYKAIYQQYYGYFWQKILEFNEDIESQMNIEAYISLKTEYENLRAVMNYCLEEENGGEMLLLFAAGLFHFWLKSARFQEGWYWLKAGLNQAKETITPELLALALTEAASLAHLLGDERLAMLLDEKCLEVYRKLGDENMFNNIFNPKQIEYAYDRYRLHLASREDLMAAISRTEGENNTIKLTTMVYWIKAHLASEDGDYVQARILLGEALQQLQKAGYQRGICYCLLDLGFVALHEGRVEEANFFFEQSHVLALQLRDIFSFTESLTSLGFIRLGLEDYEKAASCLTVSLILCPSLGDKEYIYRCILGLIQLAEREGQLERAACLYGFAEILAEGFDSTFRETAHRDMAELLELFGERASTDVFIQARDKGRIMTEDEVVSYACTRLPNPNH